MGQSFYWYDLETTGIDARWDRIVQFAGLRTDADLKEVGEEYCTYVQLADDVLPNPDAAMVTGITPDICQSRGITEWQALRHIYQSFSVPGTCVVGYNSLRFDDEFMRYGFYRGLMDPYAREWQHGNSRWDIIDLVRATGALRRDGIRWPTDEEGLPVYRLERLTEENDLEHGQAHDAMSDVRATLALARLIRARQPKLFDYYLNSRSKKQVRALLEPFGSRLCVHVSGMYPRSQFGTAPVMSLCRHPQNSNAIVVADLSRDVESLIQWPEDRIREALFKADNPERPPLKEIRINRCPFVAGIEVLSGENWSRLGFDRKVIQERQRRLSKPGIAQKLMRVYSRPRFDAAPDVEAALYDGFLDEADKARCRSLQTALAEGQWLDLDYADSRLDTLASRLKARSFPELMSSDERADWHSFVNEKLSASDAPWLTLQPFEQRLDKLETDMAEATGSTDAARAQKILHGLRDHASRLREAYGL